MPRRGGAIDIDIEVVPRYRPFGERAPGAGDHLDGAFHLFAQPFEFRQVGAENLDPGRRPDSGREHVVPCLDRHGPGVGDTGEPDRRIHCRYQPVIGHPLSPLRLRPEGDRGLEHVEPRWIGCGVGAAGLAPDVVHFGKALEDAVLDAENFPGPGNAHPGQGGRHEENGPLIQGRHELAPDPRPGNHGEEEDDERGSDRRSSALQDKGDDGTVQRDQPPVDRIGPLPMNAASDEQPHGDRHEGHGEKTRRRHCERLGVGEGLEEPARLPWMTPVPPSTAPPE